MYIGFNSTGVDMFRIIYEQVNASGIESNINFFLFLLLLLQNARISNPNLEPLAKLAYHSRPYPRYEYY